MTLPSPIPSTAFSDGELTNEIKWYTRIFTVINSILSYVAALPTFLDVLAPYTGTSAGVLTVQSGSALATTDGSGNATISFPSTFPNGLVSLVVSLLDSSTATHVKAISSTLSSFVIKAYLSSGAAATSVTIRVSFIAVGS